MKLLKTHKKIQIDKAKYNFLMFNFRKCLKYTIKTFNLNLFSKLNLIEKLPEIF